VGLENFIIAMACEDDKVEDVVGTKTLENEPFLASRERDLIQALKETGDIAISSSLTISKA
jgi:hypothetical protein